MNKVKKRKIGKDEIEYLYSRRFLNYKSYHSTAFVFADIRITSANSTYASVDAELKISDCFRQIDLSLDTGSTETTRNTLRKLDVLIATLQEARKAMAMASKDCEALCEKNKKEEAKKRKAKQNG